ncbi:hypothetical protein [Teredinibacter purpureus]|uniref:hypothetical protein n=1 Tax=Teredinibacter purpureus TaxID=2731756 RepID=UPI0005F8295C|nr:hypothetical protein [Teredinibacter purpureus]
MKYKLLASLNIVVALISWPLLFQALVFGMRAADQPATLAQNVFFAVPIIMFSSSIWLSGFLFTKTPRLALASSIISAIVIGANIYAVATM